MTKNFKYFFIFLFLLSCGYTPVYQIKKDEQIKKYLENKEIIKTIYIENKLINFIIN